MGRVAPFLIVMVLVLPGCRSATPTPLPAAPTVEMIRPTTTATAVVTPPTMTPIPTATPTQPPTATIAPVIPTLPFARDCGKTAQVSAWEDRNADGIRDYPNEPPLAGVNFVLINRAGQTSRPLARGTTGVDGTGRLSSPLLSCDGDYEFEVYAELPAGYRATTLIRGQPPVFSAFEVGFAKEP